MRVLRDDGWFKVEADDDAKIAIVTRSDRPFTDLALATEVLDALIALNAGAALSGFSLLFDTRAVRGRNDDEFERLLSERRARLFAGFSRRAVVVKGAVGALQIRRMGRDAGLEVFEDLDAARAWLVSGA